MLKKARIIGGALVVPVILSALLGVVYLVLAQEGDSPVVTLSNLLAQAAQHESVGEYAQAEAIYQGIAANHSEAPEAFEAQHRLADLYIRWNKDAESQAAYEALISNFSTHPKIAPALLEIGNQYQSTNKFTQALGVYNAMLRHWPQDESAFDAKKNMAIVYLRLKDRDAGEQVGFELLSQYPESERTAYAALEIAKVFQDNRDAKHAIPFCERANQLGPTYVSNWYELGSVIGMQGNLIRCYLERGQEEPAQRVLDDLKSNYHNDEAMAHAIRWAGNAYMSRGLYGKALECYQYIVSRWPDMAEQTMKVQRGLAEIHLKMGNLEALDASIAKMIANSSGDDQDTRHILSIAELVGRAEGNGNLNRARNLYQNILDEVGTQYTENRFQAYYGLIRTAIDMTDFSAAESAMNRFIGECGAAAAMPRTLYGFAQVYQKVGATQEAKRLYKEIARLRFDSSNAHTQGELKEMDQIYIEILRQLKDEGQTSEEALATAYNCLEVFQNAEENNKLSYVALEFAAAGFRDAKRLDLGTEEIEKVISTINPTTEPYRLACAHCTRGVLLSWQHRRLEAIEAFEKAAVDTGENMSKVHQDLCSLALGEAYQITAYHFHRKAKAQEYLQEIRTRWPDGRFEDRIQECNRYVYKR